MGKKYTEYKQLNLTEIGNDVLKQWEENNTFEKSLKLREGHKPFIFYEGPPSANGQPGIHHVMARAIKDIFCRYKSQKGYYVSRKAGWDTHGLPVELGVEKRLGITKEDIGVKISVDEYNKACKEEVMKYKDMWDKLTKQMGYWVDLENPYITFKNEYIETLWYLLGQLYKKGYMYKGYTIQPFSPAAGTGLSSHELNMPGAYKDVKDTTCVAMFKVNNNNRKGIAVNLFEPRSINITDGLQHTIRDKNILFGDNTYFLAWTTTPWTLPSNTALAVGRGIDYVVLKTINPYSKDVVKVILALSRLNAYFNENEECKTENEFDELIESGQYNMPFYMYGYCQGNYLVTANLEYEQLLPWVNLGEGAFRVIGGDFVTTEDGTGIVHIAPTFGADDDRVAKQSGVPPLVVFDKENKRQPLVDRQGRFYPIENLSEEFVQANINVEEYKKFAGKYVKNAYDANLTEKDMSLDVEIAIALKEEGKVFRIEKHVHNYPHCWRTDKPILYYPLDSWFIRTTAVKERMMELNKTINWKPESTGTGRFGNWLENLVDWNLSRSRYWGTPLPIWRTEDGKEEICVSSVEELRKEIDKSVEAGFMSENKYSSSDYESFDLHRPYIDSVVLVSSKGEKMFREPDLIDVWFDSGAMPYAQLHYPFGADSNKLKDNFPADFIAEGVDQTRGWFFTLHAIGVLAFDSIAFKNVVSNGLVLDKKGNKMSKRLGNGVDPFETIGKYGPDATRWYMISNSQPWENLKFDIEGVDEVRRKLFGTLYNTYSFFALYANIDGFSYKEEDIKNDERAEIDRWILSELNSLVELVDNSYNDYEPTRAARAIQNFVDEYLSNWYVRLSRRRFWKGEYSKDKISAYQTLYTCLETLSRLMAPISPFFSERMFNDLNNVTKRYNFDSVHLTDFPEAKTELIDKNLEERMQLAQKICSMVLSLRKRNNLKVRQPLQKILIPSSGKEMQKNILSVKELILSEVNIKEIEFLSEDNNILVKKIKPNFKSLGAKLGSKMKSLTQIINSFTQEQILEIENNNQIQLEIEGEKIELLLSDVEIITQDIPGWVVMNEGNITIALDTTITPSLKREGIARELVNRIQNIRKDQDFEVTDNIIVDIEYNTLLEETIQEHQEYIMGETLTKELNLRKIGDISVIMGDINMSPITKIDIIEELELTISVRKY